MAEAVLSSSFIWLMEVMVFWGSRLTQVTLSSMFVSIKTNNGLKNSTIFPHFLYRKLSVILKYRVSQKIILICELFDSPVHSCILGILGYFSNHYQLQSHSNIKRILPSRCLHLNSLILTSTILNLALALESLS